MDNTKQAKEIDFSVIVMLESLIQDLGINHGHDTQGRLIANVEELTEIAGKLSTIAGKEPPWTWRYLRNILNGNLTPSKRLENAIMTLGASIDGLPVMLAKAQPAPMVYMVHELRPGTVILVKGKQCANPSCGVWFVGYPASKYCCKECRDQARKFRRDNER